MSLPESTPLALSCARVRLRAAATLLLLLTVSWPLGVVWYGLPTLWQDYPKAIRRQWLTLLRGKTGPYRGVVW